MLPVDSGPTDIWRLSCALDSHLCCEMRISRKGLGLLLVTALYAVLLYMLSSKADEADPNLILLPLSVEGVASRKEIVMARSRLSTFVEQNRVLLIGYLLAVVCPWLLLGGVANAAWQLVSWPRLSNIYLVVYGMIGVLSIACIFLGWHKMMTRSRIDIQRSGAVQFALLFALLALLAIALIVSSVAYGWLYSALPFVQKLGETIS